jgi:hypothetical protein
MTLDHYTCAKCGERCASTRPDDEAIAEYERLYKRDEASELCNDCHKLFRAWLAREGVT